MFEFGIDSGNGWTVSYQLQLLDSTTNSSTMPNVTAIQVKERPFKILMKLKQVK